VEAFTRGVKDLPKLPQFITRPAGALIVFIFVCFAWIFFRAPSLGKALQMIQGIASLDGLSFSDIPYKFWAIKGLFLVVLLIVIESLANAFPQVHSLRQRLAARIAIIAVLLWAIALGSVTSNSTFIYAQF
jgi:amino acid permease